MADVSLYRCASSARHWRRQENVNRHHSSSSRNTRQKRMCRIRMKNELRRHSECQPCIKTDKNKLIDIHRLSCPIFSDAKSQCAHGNNAKRYIITAALLNFCGWSGTELLSGRETWEGGGGSWDTEPSQYLAGTSTRPTLDQAAHLQTLYIRRHTQPMDVSNPGIH